eukprot:CAMPEP_0117668436 /NCGR_PEP_ID=MMETSP0804-20121206/11551_1 /TAXON_ID=1074897 /ORGANISM="Tetraselmis astigmatica, Strain CCMP880" /LENGTH=319 /DNA_ID=CAMNT_0005476333 /DNA_START=364 /DNA_END=1324 /DNA_ORIENTATION=-
MKRTTAAREVMAPPSSSTTSFKAATGAADADADAGQHSSWRSQTAHRKRSQPTRFIRPVANSGKESSGLAGEAACTFGSHPATLQPGSPPIEAADPSGLHRPTSNGHSGLVRDSGEGSGEGLPLAGGSQKLAGREAGLASIRYEGERRHPAGEEEALRRADEGDADLLEGLDNMLGPARPEPDPSPLSPRPSRLPKAEPSGVGKAALPSRPATMERASPVERKSRKGPSRFLGPTAPSKKFRSLRQLQKHGPTREELNRRKRAAARSASSQWALPEDLQGRPPAVAATAASAGRGSSTGASRPAAWAEMNREGGGWRVS